MVSAQVERTKKQNKPEVFDSNFVTTSKKISPSSAPAEVV